MSKSVKMKAGQLVPKSTDFWWGSGEQEDYLMDMGCCSDVMKTF